MHEDIEQDNVEQARKACKRLTFLSVFKGYFPTVYIYCIQAVVRICNSYLELNSCSRNIAKCSVEVKQQLVNLIVMFNFYVRYHRCF